MTISNEVIKVLEQNHLQSKMPADLKAYLFNRYSSEPVPYEFSEQDLYSNIKRDIDAYLEGKLDLTIKSLEELLKDDIESLLMAYGEAMTEKNKQSERIRILQDFIQYYQLNELFESYKEDPQPVFWDDGAPL